MGGLSVRFRVVPYATRFRAPVSTSRGEVGERAGFFVLAESARSTRLARLAGLAQLAGPEGSVGSAVGVGEVAPLPSHGTEDLTAARAALARVERRVCRLDLATGSGANAAMGRTVLECIDSFLELAGVGFDTPAARCGIEVALLDLAGKLRGRRVADLLDGPARRRVPVNALLGSDEPADLVREARVACAAGFRTLKAKIGARSVGEDLARIRALRQEVGPDVALRLDANRAWDLATARRALADLESLGIEFVEEPLADPSQLAALWDSGRRIIPVAADESARSEAWVCRILASGTAEVVVLKAPVVGGLGATLRLARAVVAARAKVVISSALDREIGVAAALQVACALPGLELACGLATLSRLDGPGCPDLEPSGGVMTLPGGPGLGIAVPPEIAV